MRLAKEDTRDRAEGGGGGRISSWARATGPDNRRWAGTCSASRDFCRGSRGQEQRGRLRRRLGQHCRTIRRPGVLAARGGSRKAGPPSCSRIGGNGTESGRSGAGSAARPGDVAACSSRCGAMPCGRRDDNRALAMPPGARPHGKSTPGSGSGSVGGDHIVPAHSGRACSKRCPDPLERPRRAFGNIGGRSPGTTGFHCGIAASAGTSGRGGLVS